MPRPQRLTADLRAYPDLVVIYLGMRATSPRGLLTLLRIGPQIRRSALDRPDGLLRHDFLLWRLFPPHLGIRQYWRDFATLERWARELPHANWWRNQLADAGGTGFWHETYLLQGGMESVYLDMPPTGFGTFAPAIGARRSLFSARRRLQLDAEVDPPSVVTEREIDE